MSAMTTPATPLDRAKRVQELSAKATEGPWMQPDDEAMVLPDDDEIDTPKIAECCRDPTEPATPEEIANAVFIAKTRTLAPALAKDVTQLVALWELCKPLCQHAPEVAEKARALGLLPERKESES